MIVRIPRWAVLGLVGSFLIAAKVSADWNSRIYQRIQKDGAARSAAYGFLNFNRDFLEISYKISENDFQKYNNAYGYRDENVKALQNWRKAARQDAYQLALQTGQAQAQYNAVVASVDRQYEQKLREYLGMRGFILKPGNIVQPDMSRLVRFSKNYLKSVAAEIDRFAVSHQYESRDTIGAVLSLMQTAIHYREPDPVYKNVNNGGLLPPVTCLVLGWGDCDTKTGLLGSILANWPHMRMVGINVPGHYLMGVLVDAEAGDHYIQYNGLEYVLVEPVGPAWIPLGHVADATLAELDAPEGYHIYPFF